MNMDIICMPEGINGVVMDASYNEPRLQFLYYLDLYSAFCHCKSTTRVKYEQLKHKQKSSKVIATTEKALLKIKGLSSYQKSRKRRTQL